MYPALIGRKVGMTQIFDEAGNVQPVTVVQAGPCVVLQIKRMQTDGYDAVQIGYEDVRPQRATRPAVGHAARAGTWPKKVIREVRLTEAAEGVEVGQTLTVKLFQDVAYVDVTGTSKGKGFAGVMKRHNFRGQSASHGTERKHRSPGSISSHGTDLGHGGNIKKGKRMAGHMGAARCTSRNHRLLGVDVENNLLLIKGSLPGANGGYLFVTRSHTARVKKA
ncbi:MAG: 50S ribosomal protein L3 [Planctomycetales bacterium 4484_123]|nr:MAG: 50S ribosomal protein L3 [Planctomycetales bacterium 4484_123]